MAARVLVAVLAVACLSHAHAQLALCTKGKTPAEPKNVRILSQKWDNNSKKTQVTIAFDNPTNSNTGCPQSFTISMKDSKGTALGSTQSFSNAVQSPVTATYYLSPAERYTVTNVKVTGTDGKTASTSPLFSLRFQPQGAGVTTGRKMI